MWEGRADLRSEDCIMPEYVENNAIHVLEHNFGQ